MNLEGVTRALARHCSLKEKTESTLSLSLDPSQVPLLNDRVKTRLNQALNDYFSRPIKLDIIVEPPSDDTPAAVHKRAEAKKQAQATQSIQEDSNVQAILTQFNGKIVPDSIESID